MLIGDKSELAIGWEVVDCVDNWIFGNFYLFIKGWTVGNPNDFSVDLKGCLNWMTDFVEVERNRFEFGLYDKHKDQIFLLLSSSVIDGQDDYRFVKEIYKDTFSRFHISHIGMSSFDNVIVLLVKNEMGDEQCIWREGNNSIQNAYLKPDALEDLFKIASFELKKDIDKIKMIK